MKILVVDDNQSLVKGLVTFLNQEGHHPYSALTLSEARAFLNRIQFDLVITDLKLPDGHGLELIRTVRLQENPAEVILMTAYGSVETAVEAMKLGALDYLTKPVPLEEFAFRIDRVVKMHAMSEKTKKLVRAHNTLLESTGLATPLDELVGTSIGITKVKEIIKKIAPFPSTVLLTGETGTGKEMVARAIHALSTGSDGPFVRVNCASIPDTLFESELFGHEKGAFTDANERRIGKFEASHGGTLFLDEVGEVPLGLQSKLLRALQEKEITRVGGNKPLVVDTRILAATNRDLDGMVRAGQFREDLLYRLAVIRIAILPLRERQSDIPLLAEHLLEKFRHEFGKPHLKFTKTAINALSEHNWPGNIRELKNAIERSVVLSDCDQIDASSFTWLPRGSSLSSNEPTTKFQSPERLTEALESKERTLIMAALERCGGVKSRAAEELGIPRTNLLYRIKRLGLLPDSPDEE